MLNLTHLISALILILQKMHYMKYAQNKIYNFGHVHFCARNDICYETKKHICPPQNTLLLKYLGMKSNTQCIPIKLYYWYHVSLKTIELLPFLPGYSRFYRNIKCIKKLKMKFYTIIIYLRADPSLQAQKQKLQFCRKQVFHRKLRNQGCSFIRYE